MVLLEPYSDCQGEQMTEFDVPKWLLWARELHAIGQSGLFYSVNVFDKQRYQRLVDLSAEMISTYADIPPEPLKIALTSQAGYITPKVDVRGAVFKDDQILMVKEWSDGCWSLPGGWADVNEPPSAMVEREVWEESGFRVKARKIIGVYESNHDRQPVQVFHVYKLIFLCDLVDGKATPSYETPEVGFFSLDKLPPFSSARTRMEHIQEAHAQLLDPTRPTVFS
jgi:ADP-ribose pyrophosphatase YjhB (NUDIX family)